MTACTHRLFGIPDALLCTRDAHDDGEHTYVGSSAADHTTEPYGSDQ